MMMLKKQLKGMKIYYTIVMEEQWKKIEGYENYKVSNKGRIRNTRTKKFLVGGVNNCGYVKIGLTKEKKLKQFQMHRLVAQAFVDNPEHKELVRHRDNDNLNNEASNLYWVSFLEFQAWTNRPRK
jgi:hypothetical protein